MLHLTAKCPNPDCALAFPVEGDRAGKNMPCPACGQVITIRPEQQALDLAEQRARSARQAAGRTERVPYVFLGPAEEEGLRALADEGARVSARDLPGSRAVDLEALLAS